ncbi:MAG: hypothetical protein KGZ83_02325 [Sulfuricella sp.]|nr:hypothetical protein [Sulfuricella sp.]
MKNLIACGLAVISAVGAITARAAEVSLSGFATAGYARSDQDYNYQRFVDQQGTFKRDSVLGAQMDVKLNNEFGVTLQGKLAPSMNSDQGVDATVSWAFLSWRPTNDWLIRVGRLRIPVYLQSENMDVGATFDFARLPAEVYSSVQTTDGDGLFVGKTWNLDDYELTLNGYWASAKMHYRYYRRDDAQPLFSAGSYFVPVKSTARGLILTLQRDDDTLRVSAHDIATRITDDQWLPVTFPYVAMMPGVGYYQTTNLLPGPGVQSVADIRAMAYTLAADVAVGNGFRVMGEYVRRNVPDVATGPDSQGAYLALLKPMGAWTPYVSVARLESMERTRSLYNKVNGNSVPAFIPGAALINVSQRAGADGINAYDQTTWALGTSYRLGLNSKVKAEWARTRSGDMSLFIDAPPGGQSGKQVVNVLTFSYNVVF